MALIGFVKNWHKENEENRKTKNNILPKIITTNIEHAAVLETLNFLEKEKLIEIIYLKVDETGKIKENDLREILKESGPENKDNIILVSVMYVNNETGRVQPLKEIGRVVDLYNKEISDAARVARGKESSITYHIDAMQAGNYLDMDIKKLRCDMLSFNGSKIYGPKGVGVLFKSKKINIESISFGGGQEHGLRSGTEDIQKIVGMAKALEIAKEKKDSEIIRLLDMQKNFLEKIKIEIPEVKIYTHKNNENKIVQKKLESGGSEAAAIKQKDDLKINYFNIDSLLNNINIGLPGMQSDEMVVRLDYAGFDISHKSACASNEIGEGSYVLRAMGATEKESSENIRISMGRNTKPSEMESLILCIKDIYYKYRVI
jgi:cysteine desulfurase